MKPKLAVTNIFEDVNELTDFAGEHSFQGIDWSFDLDTPAATPLEESRWVKEQALLAPFEVRYHCPFYRIDLGHDDSLRAGKAGAIFRNIVRIVSKARGRYLSIHIGLGRDSTEPLSWETTITNLRQLVQFGAEHNVKVCLENLAWGWTSRPNLFEKLIRRSGAGVTFDIGHAQVCESVQTQQFAVEDFLTPHADRVFNAHVYNKEVSGLGHTAPERLEEIKERLDLLQKTACRWWVIEIKEPAGLLQTKKILDDYLTNSNVGDEQDAKGL
jgi:sugar phosphate isomerase/epimerase